MNSVAPKFSDNPFLNVLRSMAQRIDFAPGKYLLQRQALPTSIGWESSINRAAVAAVARTDRDSLLANLTADFAEHTLVGEKAVLYYGFSGLATSDKNFNNSQVELKARTLNVPKSEYSLAYPLAVHDDDRLKAMEDLSTFLTAIFVREKQTFFVFSSVRSFNERVSIDRSVFNDEDKERLLDYSELIGVRALRRQCFDVVVYDPERELVELRLDCPDGMPNVQKRTAILRLIAAFNSYDIFENGWSPFGVAPFNFHMLMKNLYKHKDEGSAFQLGFTASSDKTASNNGARLLRNKNLDLRKDEFHVGGAEKVRDISIYTIGVEWKSDIGYNNPMIIVPGSAKMLYKPPYSFNELYIRGCIESNQYDLLTRKIKAYSI